MLHNPRGISHYRKSSDLYSLYDELLDRLERVEPEVHAYLPEPGRRERVLGELDALLARYPDRESRPPLFAVPIGVKDLFRTEGFQTRAGSQLPPQVFAGPEATSVARLRKAGALVIGKTVTTEFAYFAPGPTTNPWNTAHTPGGSSSGSAAAVSAGTAALALGTQTIGSINRPASFCGVTGFKPSYGRVSTNGVVPFSVTADHVGLLAADTETARAAAAVLWNRWQADLALPATVKRELRLILLEDRYTNQADSQMLDAVNSAAKRLEAAGHTVVRASLFDDIVTINETHNLMVAREFANTHSQWFTRYGELYSEHSRELVARGQAVSDAELDQAIAGRMEERARIHALLEQEGADLILSPSAPGAAPQGLEATGSPLLNLPWTYAGVPTVTLYAGITGGGLPLGIQLAGRFDADEKLISVAAHLETLLASPQS